MRATATSAGPGRVPQLPAGHPARRPRRPELTEFFASIDAGLGAAPAAAPKTQRNDRDILNLLTKRASVLHLGAGELLLVIQNL